MKHILRDVTITNLREKHQICDNQKEKQEHSDIGPSAYFAKLVKKKVNEEKKIEKHRK